MQLASNADRRQFALDFADAQDDPAQRRQDEVDEEVFGAQLFSSNGPGRDDDRAARDRRPWDYDVEGDQADADGRQDQSGDRVHVVPGASKLFR
jgi:hypothetical protein